MYWTVEPFLNTTQQRPGLAETFHVTPAPGLKCVAVKLIDSSLQLVILYPPARDFLIDLLWETVEAEVKPNHINT